MRFSPTKRQVVCTSGPPPGTTHYLIDEMYMPDGTLLGPGSMRHKGLLCNRNAIGYAVTEGDKPVKETPTCKRCAKYADDQS